MAYFLDHPVGLSETTSCLLLTGYCGIVAENGKPDQRGRDHTHMVFFIRNSLSEVTVGKIAYQVIDENRLYT